MELPINYKDLDTIVQSLAVGCDAWLYNLLKNIRDDEKKSKLDVVECDI